MKRNLGLVGCGHWSNKIIEELNCHNKFLLKSIVCRNISRINKKYKLKSYTNILDMINNESLDCLYIATNPRHNVEVFNLVKKLNIATIFEKPLSNNYEDAIKIYEYAKENKKVYLTNLPNLYSDTYEQSSKFIKNNIYNIKRIILIEGDNGPNRTNIHPVLDWGIHPLTYILKLFKNYNPKYLNHYYIKKNYNENFFVSKFILNFNKDIKINILTGNKFKKKTRMIKIILKNGDTFINNFLNHELFYNDKKIFKSNNSPLSNLLDFMDKNINIKIKESDIENLFLTARALKIIEQFIKVH